MQYIDDKRNDSLNVRIPYQLKRKLKEYATFQEMKLSEMVVRMLAQQVGQLQYQDWKDDGEDQE